MEKEGNMSDIKSSMINKYLMTSGHLVIKFGQTAYRVKDMATGLGGTCNEEMKRILLLSDGQNLFEEVARLLAAQCPASEEAVAHKLGHTVDYLAELGLVRLAGKPGFSPVIMRGKKLDWPLDHVFLEMPMNGAASNGPDGEETFARLVGQLIDLGVLDVTVVADGPWGESNGASARLRHLRESKLAIKVVSTDLPASEAELEALAALGPELWVVDLGALPASPGGYAEGSAWATLAGKLKMANAKGIRAGARLRVADAESRLLEMALDLIAPTGIKKIFADTRLGENGGGESWLAAEAHKTLAERMLARLKTMEGQQIQKVPEIRLGDACPLTDVFPGCGVGASSCFVKANGDVGLCVRLADGPYVAGNVGTTSLEEIWSTAEVFEPFRGHSLKDIEKCAQCFYRSRCRGGCVAHAFVPGGDLVKEPDVLSCSYYEGVAAAVARNLWQTGGAGSTG